MCACLERERVGQGLLLGLPNFDARHRLGSYMKASLVQRDVYFDFISEIEWSLLGWKSICHLVNPKDIIQFIYLESFSSV